VTGIDELAASPEATKPATLLLLTFLPGLCTATLEQTGVFRIPHCQMVDLVVLLRLPETSELTGLTQPRRQRNPD
jgi:hypothetical protein